VGNSSSKYRDCSSRQTCNSNSNSSSSTAQHLHVEACLPSDDSCTDPVGTCM
jgi:hypothetical protein